MIFTPVLASFLTALCCLFAGRSLRWVRGISLTGAFIGFLCSVNVLFMVIQSGPLRLQFGNWEKPFGIFFHIDLLGAVLLMISSLLGLCGVIASLATLSPKTELRGYHPLYHFLILGVLGAFSTGDLFNLYVWFEVLLVSSFFLLTVLKKKNSFGGAFKYAVLSILSSFIFLIGIALVYSAGGSLDLTQLHALYAGERSLTFQLGLASLALAFLIKAGVFPFYFWLPASYPEGSTAVIAVFSGLLTKVGIYGLLRVLVPFGDLGSAEMQWAIYFMALFSMVLGVLGALSQDNIKGILSFHIISQVGYIALGLSLGTELGIAAAIFYLIHHMVVKTNLFFTAAYIEQRGQGLQVSRLGGLWQSETLLGVLFLFSALSLIGIPPLSGFWAKVFTVQAVLKREDYLGLLLCLGVSLFTLMSMLKIWLGAFFKPSGLPAVSPDFNRRRKWLYVPLVILNLWTVLVGLNANAILEYSKQMVVQVQDRGQK
ncbi:hypothetical protein AZI86_02400 [Bdellovibrio bacteriovorus]|uniref:NADH:quinone oxidoreductase/Mrp antiporter transmembrane domain-containing protein n=1 Tax=Bdellovibrio bacteriovorus TaxID=959 RepID=A0A150WN99_BDEBC|nr:proton-conducting transporter membrane subunit [Bdellovibrio bacteriovorus]KYG65942.1 hypothetical protein AZI86_02400 [Bdellovibrio bacteriovorus]